MNWTYSLIMLAAWATGLTLLFLTRQPLGVDRRSLAALALGAFCGGMIGAKLPFVLADWPGFVSGQAWFHDGKTIMSGLVGGYLGAMLTEWALGIQNFTCDVLAAPLAAGIGVGRLACFSAGCCYGTATSLPWGVNFGDGCLRHPTQLYESAFHLTAAAVLFQLQRRQMFRGQLVRLYFVAYFIFRFFTEFIRPEARIFFGLTGYQMAALVLAPFFALWCCPSTRPQLLWPWRRARRTYRDAPAGDHLLKPTRTLCPVCLKPAAGATYERDHKIYLRRTCPEHGTIDALVSSDRRHYYLRDEVPHPPPQKSTHHAECDEYTNCCGPEHRSCIGLVEITDACNLHCPVCFAQSPSGQHREVAEVVADVRQFIAARGPLDILQLSGGEPLVHPQLLEIIDQCRKLSVGHIMINTNGRQLARDANLAAELARRKPRLELNLQFDGLDAQSHVALRGADLLAEKKAALDRAIEHQLPTTLVCTVVQGVNEHELGPLLKLGLETPTIRGITFQPATWTGRYEPRVKGDSPIFADGPETGATNRPAKIGTVPPDPMQRATLADVVRGLVQQSGGLLADDDFKPLPCSDPNCCGFTYVARRRPVIALTRIVKYEEHLDALADRMAFDMTDAGQCCGGNWKVDEFLRIVVKPFMDAYTYDQDRIDECCVHIIRPGGRAVSFCQYNALER
jgi:uncharacterized radical SAM superfamily Fe-S cluster-containing enzyme/prolipoprotein diacylglyceryltransferase